MKSAYYHTLPYFLVMPETPPYWVVQETVHNSSVTLRGPIQDRNDAEVAEAEERWAANKEWEERGALRDYRPRPIHIIGTRPEKPKMSAKTFQEGDRVQWTCGDDAGDKGTVSRTFERDGDGIPYFVVDWDDGEVIDYMDWPGTGCRKIGG